MRDVGSLPTYLSIRKRVINFCLPYSGAETKYMKEQIMNALMEFNKNEGIAFMSENDALNYYKALVELIEELIIKFTTMNKLDTKIMELISKHAKGQDLYDSMMELVEFIKENNELLSGAEH